MSYAKLVKSWEKQYKLKQKQEQKQRKEKKEKELKFAEEKFFAEIREEKKQREEQEQKTKKRFETKENILQAIQQNNPFTYSQFLIVWDIFTYNYIQIQTSLNKNKISIADIKAVFQYIENFSSEIIDNYWKDQLLNIVEPI